MDLGEKVKAKKQKTMDKIQGLLEKRSVVESKLIELEAKENPSDTQEMRLIEKEEKLNDQLDKITIYFFDPVINITTPSRLIELCNIPLILEEVDSYKKMLVDTDYADCFVEIKASQINDYLAPNSSDKKFLKIRKILENEKIDLSERIKKINKWKFWNSALYKDCINRDDQYKKITTNKLTFGDYLIAKRFSELGLPFAIDVYIKGFRSQNDFYNKDINKIYNIDGVGPKRKQKIEEFFERVRSTDNFDKILFKLGDSE